MNNFTDLCECNPGWENEDNLDYWDNFIPSTVPLNMCTIRMNISEKNFFKILKNALFVIPENWTIAELVSFHFYFHFKSINFNIVVVLKLLIRVSQTATNSF